MVVRSKWQDVEKRLNNGISFKWQNTPVSNNAVSPILVFQAVILQRQVAAKQSADETLKHKRQLKAWKISK